MDAHRTRTLWLRLNILSPISGTTETTTKSYRRNNRRILTERGNPQARLTDLTDELRNGWNEVTGGWVGYSGDDSDYNGIIIGSKQVRETC